MASNFKTLQKAKKEYKKRVGVEFGDPTMSTISIFNRNNSKQKDKAKLKKPYFVGSYFEYLNI